MDIDLSILRMLEREKEISFEVLAEAIEQALLTAYQRATESSHPARVELDRKTGHVTVWAREIDEDMKLAAARAIAEVISDDEVSEDYVIPSVFDERVAPAVAETVAEAGKQSGQARRVSLKDQEMGSTTPLAF